MAHCSRLPSRGRVAGAQVPRRHRVATTVCRAQDSPELRSSSADVQQARAGLPEMRSSEEPQDVARRQLLQAPILLLPALAAASPAKADIQPTLPPQTVPGSPLPDGEATLISQEAANSLIGTERQVYANNRRIQAQNRTPPDFPGFVRVGFDVKIVGDYQLDPSGLYYHDYNAGSGPTPTDGQEVVFNYTGYNESGALIDSSYRQGRPAQTRLGIQGMIPGFEIGLRGMRVGQVRRIIIPPALGPPVGPSTFFSAKQCEVFDIEMLKIRNCERRQMAMFSDVVCTDI